MTDSDSTENTNSRIRVRVAGLFRNQQDEILFVEHRKGGRRQLLLPGGRLDYSENHTEALQREFSEELDLKIAVHDCLFVAECIDPAGSRHLLQSVFAVTGIDVTKIRLGGDPAVVGFHLLGADAIQNAPVYPAQNQVLIQLLKGEKISTYHNIPWAEI